jgi:hypothetical protein
MKHTSTIAVFGVLALGAIFWTATISPFARQEDEKPDRNRELAKFAVNKDAPKLTFKGKVLNPDGTPARELVTFNSIAVYENPRTEIFGDSSAPWNQPTYYTSTSCVTAGSDKEGMFEFSEVLPAGTYMMIYAYSGTIPRKLVSQPVVFRTEADRDDITIQLLEGIPVYGTVMFDDGTPADGRSVAGVRHVLTLPGVKDENAINHIKNNSYLDFQAPVQEDGKFELYLPPGNFMIREFGDNNDKHAVPITIHDPKTDKDAKQEYRVDLVYPAPLRGKFVKEDGTEPGELKVNYGAKTENGTGMYSFTMQPKSGGKFSLDKRTGSFLFAVTKEGSFGIIHPIPDDQLAEYQTVVLKPTATVQLKLRDSSGSPVVGKSITAQIVSRMEGSESMTHIAESPSITDDEGVAVFKIPSGTGCYHFSWEGGQFEGEQTFQPGETAEIAVLSTERNQSGNEPPS